MNTNQIDDAAPMYPAQLGRTNKSLSVSAVSAHHSAHHHEHPAH